MSLISKEEERHQNGIKQNQHLKCIKVQHGDSEHKNI